jgi:transcriptional regulator NrdR family protein
MTRLNAPRGSRTEARASELGNHNHLTCPTCGGFLRYTKDSRLSVLADGTTKIVRRRRECSDCGTRHATIECTEETLFAPVLDLLDRQIENLMHMRDRIKKGGQ